MKRNLIFAGIFMVGMCFTSCNTPSSENKKGLPGDNLDLYAVMNLLKKSSNPKQFEKSLNDKSNHINNLDLNGDGKVDYIRVIDNKDGDDHAFVLRVPLSKTESQDVAVIEMEKKGDKAVNIELTGDKDLYGPDYIIQPKGEGGQAGFFVASTVVWVNVWYWPFVSYVYSPDYVVWVSPFSWEYYPEYWEPWEPFEYDVYYPYVEVYHPYFIETNEHHLTHADVIFYSHRESCDFNYIRKENEKFYHQREKNFDKANRDKSFGGDNKSFQGPRKSPGENPITNKASKGNRSSPGFIDQKSDHANQDRTNGGQKNPNMNSRNSKSGGNNGGNRDFGKPNSGGNSPGGKTQSSGQKGGGYFPAPNGGRKTMPSGNVPRATTPSGGGNRKGGGGKGGH